MRSFAGGVAASLVAAAITYVVFDAAGALPRGLRVLVAVGVAFGGIALAWAASRGQAAAAGTRVGDRVEAAGDVAVERVEVAGGAGPVDVGTNARAGGTVRVSDVRIERSGGAG